MSATIWIVLSGENGLRACSRSRCILRVGGKGGKTEGEEKEEVLVKRREGRRKGRAGLGWDGCWSGEDSGIGVVQDQGWKGEEVEGYARFWMMTLCLNLGK